MEMFHITTQSNCEPLIEMAQKLDLSPEELEQYREKLAKMQDLSESLTNKPAPSNTTNSLSGYFLFSITFRFLVVKPLMFLTHRLFFLLLFYFKPNIDVLVSLIKSLVTFYLIKSIRFNIEIPKLTLIKLLN